MPTLPGEILTGLNQKQAQETTFRAVTETAGSATEQRVKDKATALRTRLAAGPGIQGVKDMYTPLRREKGPPREDKVKDDIDARFGWERDSSGAVIRSGMTERLHKEASKQADLTRRYLDSGYDGLKDTEKQKLRDSIEKVFKSKNGENEFWKTMTDDEKKTFLEKILKDEKYQEQLGVLFEEIRKSPIENQIITDAHAALESSKKQAEVKARELTHTGADLESVNDELEEFKHTTSGGTPGIYFGRLQLLQNSQPAISRDIELFSEEMSLLKGELTELQRAKSYEGGIDKSKLPEGNEVRWQEEMGKLTKHILDLKGKIYDRQAKLDEMNSLLQRREALKSERKKLETQRDSQELANEEAEQKREQAERALEEAKKVKLDGEFDFKESLDGVFYEAAIGHLEEKFQDAARALIAQNEEDIKKTDDSARKKMLGGLNERWTKLVDRSVVIKKRWIRKNITENVKELVVQKAVIERDFNVMLQNGPELIIKAILIQPPNGMNTEDADLKLKDESFVKEMTPKVVDQLMSYAREQNLITKEKALQISGTEWGQAAMARVIEKNSKISEVMSGLQTEGKIQGATPQEWAKEIANSKHDSNFLVLLMLIFGSAFMVGKEALFSEESLKNLAASLNQGATQ